jgi:hypothetical protein
MAQPRSQTISGAAEGARTLDIQLGKLTLYQLSYGRLRWNSNLVGGGGVRESVGMVEGRGFRCWLGAGGFGGVGYGFGDDGVDAAV